MTAADRSGPGVPWYRPTPAAEAAEVRRRLGDEVADLCRRVRLLVLDADGVMTSGGLLYGPRGEAYKEFHSRDGLGLVLARAAGIKRAVLTGRNSAIVARRCAELRFEAVKLGRFDKLAALAEILAETGCLAAETLYMGDDLIDLPVLHAVGLPVTVPGAPEAVKAMCRHVTGAAGGQGAVREVCDLILMSNGRLGEALLRLGEKDHQPTAAELSSDEEG